MAEATSETLDGRERIIREAERLFGERGYRGVSIRELARACGMTNAALYYHFSNKADLFYQVAIRHSERLAQTMREEAAAAGDDPLNQLAAVARVYAEHLRFRQDTAHVFAEAMRQLGKERAHALRDYFHQNVLGAVVSVIRTGQERGVLRSVDPELAARAFIGLLGTLRFHDQQERFTEQQVEQLVDLFLHGMMARR
ncbi:MAG: TetR/AcrR family transcriptional regulator [Chloroflexi bacterium]|nr:TetR/AcrR family transcriptional regulator [Chloroflexota bacterium]